MCRKANSSFTAHCFYSIAFTLSLFSYAYSINRNMVDNADAMQKVCFKDYLNSFGKNAFRYFRQFLHSCPPSVSMYSYLNPALSSLAL